jgi:hypothetical protein
MNWIQANAAMITAFLSMIATAFAALATYRAPIMAAEVANRLRIESEKENEQRRLRMVVFFTLMQERATFASAQSVQMLNGIDAVFHDCGPVREAWADLYHALNRRDVISSAL